MRVAPDVLAVLDAATTEGPALRLNGQLDRKLYVAVAKALEEAGGKWNRKAGAHLFDGDAAEAIEPILLTGEIVSTKREFDAFFTPHPIDQRVVHAAGIGAGSRVLEPSAGHGALAKWAKFLGGDVTCVDILPAHCATLRNLGFETVCADFLALPSTTFPPFDAVVMNPPFSRQQDVRHVLHAARFLKPSGVLVAIMSASVGFRSNALTVEFRDWLVQSGGTIEPLPEGSFKASGIGVNTVVVTTRAPAAQQEQAA